MMLKARKETSAPLKAKAKANALKVKKAVMKGVHSLKKKKMHISSAFSMVQETVAPKTTQIFLEKHPHGGTSLISMASLGFPDYRVRHEEERKQQYTSVPCGCQGQQAPDQTGCKEAVGH